MKAIALIAALCAAPAAAQEYPCMQRGDLQVLLEGTFGEVSVGHGYDPRGGIIEIWVSASGTWSLLVSTPDGRSCVLASGTDYVFVEQPWPPMGEEG